MKFLAAVAILLPLVAALPAAEEEEEAYKTPSTYQTTGYEGGEGGGEYPTTSVEYYAGATPDEYTPSQEPTDYAPSPEATETVTGSHGHGKGNPAAHPGICPVTQPWNQCTPGAVSGHKSCGLRATCERFDPYGYAWNKGRFYCVCQAGYRAAGVKPWDWWQQYRMYWINARGDQTHRVFVKPQTECTQLCDESVGNPRDCDEVPERSWCR